MNTQALCVKDIHKHYKSVYAAVTFPFTYTVHLKQLDLDYLERGKKINLSKAQEAGLEKNFQCLQDLSPADRQAIAYCLLLPETAVIDWFRERRRKVCRESEVTESKTEKIGKLKRKLQGT